MFNSPGEITSKGKTDRSENFLQVPGVGAQGGDLNEVLKNGWNKSGGTLIRIRSIIFASSGVDFAEAAAAEAGRDKMRYIQFINQL